MIKQTKTINCDGRTDNWKVIPILFSLLKGNKGVKRLVMVSSTRGILRTMVFKTFIICQNWTDNCEYVSHSKSGLVSNFLSFPGILLNPTLPLLEAEDCCPSVRCLFFFGGGIYINDLPGICPWRKMKQESDIVIGLSNVEVYHVAFFRLRKLNMILLFVSSCVQQARCCAMHD